jgi:hypothetical protein
MELEQEQEREQEQEHDRRGAILEQVRQLRKDLHTHTLDEMPVIKRVEVMLQELGTPDQVRERRIFIEAFIDRERDRKRLRTAMIEKGLLLALVAFLVFVGQAVWHEIVAGIRLLLGLSK